MKKIAVLLAISMTFCSLSSIAEINEQANHYLSLEVIQDQFVFDHQSIKQATLVIRQNGVYSGLHIILKPEATAQFARMIKDGFGRKANLMFHHRIITTNIIQGPMGGDLLITGLSLEEAQLFLASLQKNHLASPSLQ